MSDISSEILERFRTRYGKDIDLTLRPAYRELLDKLGNPHNKLSPVFHVAGTNGKGSTCAFLRAMLEGQGYRVHVYTSPHLVHFHERIRVAGQLIKEAELAEILTTCEALAPPGKVSYFEAATAAALVAFARHPADFVILETGLGGRLDATNIVERPLANIITRLSMDHREYLGDTIEQIASEKAGIMRTNVPCFTALQPDAAAARTLRDAATALGAPLIQGGIDWVIEETANGFRFRDATRDFDLPPPALLGPHQYRNAGLAIAALSVLPNSIAQAAIRHGLATVEWPARLQRLTVGRLVESLPPDVELWLDGGHNDSAGEVLATQIAAWRDADPIPRPFGVVVGMLTTKHPAEFLSPFWPYVDMARTVAIEGETLSFTAEDLAAQLKHIPRDKGLVSRVEPMPNCALALRDLAAELGPRARMLICGSLYLAGRVLASNAEA